jgi:hypothetical protein
MKVMLNEFDHATHVPVLTYVPPNVCQRLVIAPSHEHHASCCSRRAPRDRKMTDDHAITWVAESATSVIHWPFLLPYVCATRMHVRGRAADARKTKQST